MIAVALGTTRTRKLAAQFLMQYVKVIRVNQRHNNCIPVTSIVYTF